MNDSDDMITLYDILLDPKVAPCSPNPWKARFALNFTGQPYQTTWVPLKDIAHTRAKLGVPAVRKHPDGSDFPTLPILHDPARQALIGDSFDIALHLHKTFPSSPPLFPGQSIALHRAFNAHVDQLFSIHGAPLAGYFMPLDPKTAAEDKAEFARRMGAKSWEEFHIPVGSEARHKAVKAFEDALGAGLAVWFVNRDEGPFIEGATPMYADFIVGGWLKFMKGCLPEWEAMKEWHGGLWGRLLDALEEWGQVV